jgi:hypothetical protein
VVGLRIVREIISLDMYETLQVLGSRRLLIYRHALVVVLVRYVSWKCLLRGWYEVKMYGLRQGSWIARMLYSRTPGSWKRLVRTTSLDFWMLYCKIRSLWCSNIRGFLR